MTVLMVPPPDDAPWPTLGQAVCAWIESELCHGPGDLLGESITLNDEQRGWIYRLYEIHPEKVERTKNRVKVVETNPLAGKRRFQRGGISVRKGYSKTEMAAWIAAAELHQDGPVRCAGFTTEGGVRVPVPRGVTDPYIPMIAYTEEQSEELAYGALRRIIEKCAIGSDFDIGLERIMRIGGDGKAEAVSASPNARDGARTTFQHADETHRFTLDTQKRAWHVMLANLNKRPLADPWALETTTAPEPGQDSVAERTMKYAEELLEKGGSSSPLFFFHRQASPTLEIDTDEGLRAAVVEASGPYTSKWSGIDRIAAAFREPDADIAYLERVWLNRPVQASAMALDVERWRQVARAGYVAPERSAITIGFDGSRYHDSTAMIATHAQTGFQWPLGIWSRPDALPADQPWEVPVDEVDGIVADAFERYHVVRMYCDPPLWESWVATWAGKYGKERVVEWWTNRRKPMAYAIRAFRASLAAAEISNDGDATVANHLANARRAYTNLTDEEGNRLWILRKERPDSPNKIDAVMAAILSWEARNDALTSGEVLADSVYEERGVLSV